MCGCVRVLFGLRLDFSTVTSTICLVQFLYPHLCLCCFQLLCLYGPIPLIILILFPLYPIPLPLFSASVSIASSTLIHPSTSVSASLPSFVSPPLPSLSRNQSHSASLYLTDCLLGVALSPVIRSLSH